MSLRPSAPTDFAALVDAWAGTVRAVIELGRTLREGDAERATDCPGWSVHDQLAHVESVESMFLGEPVPDLDVSAYAYVQGPFNVTIERLVESRRGRSTTEVLDDLQASLEQCLTAYRDQGVDPEAEVPGPFGPTTLAKRLAIRTLDVWTHEQDIREALARPGNLDTPAAAVFFQTVFDAFGGTVARRAKIAPGHAVILELTGPTLGRVGVRVEERDGRRFGVPLFTGDPESHDDVVTTTIAMSAQAAARRAAGRRPVAECHAQVTGDAGIAAAVLEAMVFTP